jgi:hypothetical protein
MAQPPLAAAAKARLAGVPCEKLPTDWDREATGEQAFELGLARSTVSGRKLSNLGDDTALVTALFGVLLKR